jgi:hypothetical protein
LVNTGTLFQIGHLKEHEEILPYHFFRLRSRLVRDGYQKNPIIIDNKHNIVLDGHHRLNILKSLGCSKIAAYSVDYLDNEKVQIETRYPIIIHSVIDPLRLFKKYCFDIDEEKNNYSKLIYKDRVFKINLTREKTMGLIRAHASKTRIAYFNSEESAKNMVKKRRAIAALLFGPISKEEVINYALSGKKFPPKTTRHIIPNRPRNWHVPFERLK